MIEEKEINSRDIALVEAIMFLETEPVDEAIINRITGLPKDTVKIIFEKLAERYSVQDSGIQLNSLGTAYMLSVRHDFWDELKDRYGKKNEGKISRAAMETLSIIAYSQPITRTEIEAIRGVSADNMIRLLTEKDLIREVGKKDIPGKPVQFGTTREFLKQFRLNTIADLPRLNEYETERFELEGEAG